jgi:hypothetical protein
MKKRFIGSLLLLLFAGPHSFGIDKLKVEEVIAKHLASIGTEKLRSSIRTRIIAGNSQVIFRTTPVGQAYGRVVLASDGLKNLIGMSFRSPVYPREEFGFDGHSFIAAFVTPGVRSSLGSFLMNHDLVFKHGLMGGTLSSAWPLFDLSQRRVQLEYAGLKKIDNRSLHEIRYMPRGGSDLKISLFFDEKTFEHVRTEYQRDIPASLGTRAYANVEERESRYKMVEEFSNYKTEQELNLPHTYKIFLIADAQSGTFSAEWLLELNRFRFNEEIDPNSFSIKAE